MTTSTLKINELTKRYDRTTAVAPCSLCLPQGGFTSILGPSGCGKTTMLMMIAGVVEPSGGQVWLDGEDITHVPLEKRGIGIVFQHYALFPNLTVQENVLYGLHGKASSSEMAARFNELAALTHLDGFANRYPDELSGGQQQRTAIARALAPNPKLLLLDEPLSALDAWTRSSIGEELREIQQKSGVTTLMVTHDRTEALALSDFIVVMNNGKIEQAGAPQTIYDSPESEFVATFVGGMNIVRLPAVNNGEPTGIRWGDVQVLLPTEASLAKPYTYVGQLEKCAFMGDNVRVELLLNDFKTRITADVSRFQPIARELTLKALYAVRLPLPGWRQWSEK